MYMIVYIALLFCYYFNAALGMELTYAATDAADSIYTRNKSFCGCLCCLFVCLTQRTSKQEPIKNYGNRCRHLLWPLAGKLSETNRDESMENVNEIHRID